MFAKENWVCTICGQDFTRRSSGNRHNSNLHNGIAKLIVRPFDYLTGRLNGQIASPADDPWAYRRYKGKDNNHNRSDNNKLEINKSSIKGNDMDWNNRTHTAIHERNKLKQVQIHQYQETNNYIYSMSHAARSSNRISKFEELKMLLYKYCRPDDARKNVNSG